MKFFICRMPTTNVLSPLWFYTTPRITNKGNQTQTKKKINCLFFKFWFLVKRETIDDGTYSSMYVMKRFEFGRIYLRLVHSDFCLIAAIGQNNHLPAEQPNSEIDDDDAKGKWPYLLLRSRHYYYVYTRLFFLLFFFSYGLLIFFFCISLIPRSLKKI